MAEVTPFHTAHFYSCVARRIVDRDVLRLTKMWLQAVFPRVMRRISLGPLVAPNHSSVRAFPIRSVPLPKIVGPAKSQLSFSHAV